jgi:subtilisin family serine protease
MARASISRQFALIAAFGALFFVVPAAQVHEEQEGLIVECVRPCAAVIAAVNAMGGKVTYAYENVDAVAVSVPRGRSTEVGRVAGPGSVSKDDTVARPRPISVVEAGGSVQAFDLSSPDVQSSLPSNYDFNNILTGATAVHQTGQIGQGIVVAMIDSGIANVPALIPALAGTIIGGETFVPPAEDALSATHRENDWHGTVTAHMITALAAFLFPNASTFVQALNLYAPSSVILCNFPGCPAGTSIVPMTGSAPGALLYALKVFPAHGDGAPESRVIAAMDRAITLRRNFNAGFDPAPTGTGSETDPFVYNALKIDVVNMSLGGPALFAGRNLEDQLTLAMLDVGITPVVAAGNDGFGAVTVGSPGTGFGGLTVAAASTAAHERILRDLQFGSGVGGLYRVRDEIQTAYFSSRGPNADGRIDPDLSANAIASYVNAMVALDASTPPLLVECRNAAAVPGTCASRIIFVSGTSLSTPTVSGAAALLKGAVPSASAVQVRNALQFSANPSLIGDGSGPIDRGVGFLDVPAALALLQSGKVSRHVPDLGRRHGHGDDLADELGKGGKSVVKNLIRAGFPPIRFVNDRFTAQVSNLLPGQVAQFFVPSDPWTSRLTVSITGITPELPEAQQNQLFGDDIFFMVIDAPTSFAVERASGFITVDTTVPVDHPQTGLVRVAIQGDWTNAGRISATVTITRQRSFNGFPSALGFIHQDDMIPFEVNVPAGAAEAVFEVAWLRNWSRYPTNDIDMVLIDPHGNRNDDGSSGDSPERVVIQKPLSGRWRAVIIGLELFRLDGKPDNPDKESGRVDFFTFRATADGRTLKARR